MLDSDQLSADLPVPELAYHLSEMTAIKIKQKSINYIIKT
jgi:hypothetical protein